MKHRTFMLFGSDKCRIFKEDEVEKFDQIRSEIRIYEFATREEMEAFQKGVDEAIGHKEYAILEDDDVSYVMTFSSDESEL
jgi:accessory colonization factor AcfC